MDTHPADNERGIVAGMTHPAPALDYASPPSARRRWMRRLRRAWPVGLLLIIAGLGIAYGPGVWRRWQVIKLQEACMTAELPVWEEDPTAARALVAAWPGEYQLTRSGWAVRADPQWAALAATLDVPAWPNVTLGYPLDTLFCHERRTPDGRRRLVVVEGGLHCTVIDPAAWPVGDGPRVVWREQVEWDAAGGAGIFMMGPSRIGAGVSDPADPTRFTAPFVWYGVPGTWEYRLGNDDRVTMRLLDPDGFTAQAKATKARAASEPVQ